MATPKRKKPYTFWYTDGTYMIYEITREDFAEVDLSLKMSKPFATISVGIVGLRDIRAVIEQKEEEQEEQQPSQDTLPVLDQESYNWIKQYMGGDN